MPNAAFHSEEYQDLRGRCWRQTVLTTTKMGKDATPRWETEIAALG